MAFKFENLNVWQRAVKFTGLVHRVTRSFPVEERFILTSQFKRATDSIALNIGERSTGSTDKQFSNYLGNAIRSGIEVVTCLYVGRERGLINQTQFDELYNEITIIIKMTQALRHSLGNNSQNDH